jgi:hypothetical protein
MSICLANARSPGRRVKGTFIEQPERKESSGRERQSSLLTNKRPIDSDDALVRKAFQRFGKQEISCAFPFLETCDSEICPTLALLNRHDSVFLDLRLQMPVGGPSLPKGVNLRFTTFFDYLRKARRFHLEKLHIPIVGTARRAVRGRARPGTLPKKARQRTTARRIRLPLLHSCPGGVRKSSIHSP